MEQFIFRDGLTFSHHTTVAGLTETLFDMLLFEAENEQEREDLVKKFCDCGDEKDRLLIQEYGYEILEPSKRLIAQWELYHGDNWEYSIQSYDVVFQFDNPCVLHVNVYREGETLLTREEIFEEAKGYMEDMGLTLKHKVLDDAEIHILELDGEGI